MSPGELNRLFVFRPVSVACVRCAKMSDGEYELLSNRNSPSEILMNLNKICNKLICGYYDKWCPVVAENRSPPSITSGENTGWAENFSMWKIAYKNFEEST